MAHILVVDDDDTARNLIAQALARPHRTIHVAAHGEEALAQISTTMPDLVITDVVMPKMNGWSLVRRLRTTHSTAFVPVILMTSLDTERDRIRGFRLGADDFVSKPVSFEELELRVENVLHHARSHDRDSLLGAALAGQLAQFGLATVLTVLELERKTGMLTVTHRGLHASLAFQKGRVHYARIEERPEVAAIECAQQLLSWNEGSFAFAEQPIDVEDEIRTGTAGLLLEAARRMDELDPIDVEFEDS